jgi:putative addiction module killer protein
VEWFRKLKDKRTKAIVDARLTRLRVGNFGICRSVGKGVLELKIDYGPGYRVYFGRDGEAIIVLLLGGDKSSQARDIERAHEFWSDYNSAMAGG